MCQATISEQIRMQDKADFKHQLLSSCCSITEGQYSSAVLWTTDKEKRTEQITMSVPESFEETSVVICGAGSTGAVLSTLLGCLGVPNIVLEREGNITNDPRGIALDEDGIRILQAIGIYERVFTEIGSCMSTRSQAWANLLDCD